MSRSHREVWRVERGHDDYPDALHDLAETAPAALHGCGHRSALAGWDAKAAVTIVGSRRASAYGIAVAEELARLLAAAGITVVSGMARGIDAAAHRGALAGGGRTVAVLGGGPDVVYPSGEWRVYRRILEDGAAISEHPAGERPAAWSFPARNRIMAALAEVTVVVEAAKRSGSLITARLANERLNRTVGAVPGPVNSWLSAGPNNLLADGALVVRDAQDVLDAMLGAGAPGVRGEGPDLEPELRSVLELVEQGHATCDSIAAAGAPPGEAAVALARLEILGYLRADPAGRYARSSLVPPDTP